MTSINHEDNKKMFVVAFFLHIKNDILREIKRAEKAISKKVHQ